MPDDPDAYLDLDAEVAAGTPPGVRRPALSRERIVAAAIEFVDEEGLPGLTMRRLGQSLGVEAMSLYRYVPGREDLLDAVVEAIVDEINLDEDVLDAPTAGWADFLLRLAHGVRRVALAHPKVFPLVASRPPEAPWLRPPLRSLAWVETFLAGLRQEGFTDEVAVLAYRAFTSFLLGNLLLEVSTHGADVGPLDVLSGGEEPAGDELASYPNVQRLCAALSEDHAAVEFEESLEALLDRIGLMHRESGA